MLKTEANVDDPQSEWGDYVLYREHIPAELPDILDGKQSWTDSRGGQGVVMLCSGTDAFMDPRAGDISIQAIHALTSRGYDVRVLTRNPVLAATGRVADPDPAVDLPSRDYLDILTTAAETGHLTVGSSINSLDADYLSTIEPDAPAPQHRLRGLETISQAGIPVYVSMSPTYPTETKNSVRTLLETLASVDPTVIFHEAINPRGDNYQGMIDAAWRDGHDALGRELARIRRTESEWKAYALEHYRWVQSLGDELELPIHIWPDAQLLRLSDRDIQAWLSAWFHRHPPERFAGRPEPAYAPPTPPTAQTGLSEF